MRESSADAGRLGSQQSNHCIPNSIGLELRVTRERTIYITKKVIGYKHWFELELLKKWWSPILVKDDLLD